MESTIKQIIEHNSPEESAQRIMKLIANSNVTSHYNIDHIRAAFEGGRTSVKAVLEYERYGEMEPYATTEVVKSFKQWMHENSKLLK